MSKATFTLGGPAAGTKISKIGHGLMYMTWVPNPVPDEQCFEAMKAGMDTLPPGTKMVLNSADFYGFNPPEANLELIARFFEKYPEYSEKAFLVVKGGFKMGTGPELSLEALRASAQNTLSKLRGTHPIDVFEPARMDQANYPLEDVMRSLKALQEEGLIKGVGLSEVSGETVRRAAKILPIVTCEIDISLWSYEKETQNVIDACKENNVAVLAYAPLSSGILSGKIKKTEDVPEGDLRHHFGRFTEDAMTNNAAIVEALKVLAVKKGCTLAQLCIAWVAALGAHVIPIPGSSKAERTVENAAAGEIALTAEDLKEIDAVLEKYPVHGVRHIIGVPKEALHLWG
ncbi:aldo/keto reductase [Stereum hirsutum FP-91666 SS1]|uniref:aldo/keto reductase n=1 Tax=Stereum hirsutum (strain FP-91666) TaxID=721885 RepID=UPI000440F6FD|nr:aldo/keto reductase [Stereum hirsutum FP-91666 SS1]EIM86405.1 aldo/keto reductase [Stereum hirsutum FP-91666 SS1]